MVVRVVEFSRGGYKIRKMPKNLKIYNLGTIPTEEY